MAIEQGLRVEWYLGKKIMINKPNKKIISDNL